ncbi:hypothetical protein ACFL96_13655 [Thermoproteota archaeon]
MYINRKGVVNDTGIKANFKDMFFDIESIILTLAKDIQDIFYDVVEDIIDLRWDVFTYKMKVRGLIDTKPDKSRISSIWSSFLSLILFQR